MKTAREMYKYCLDNNYGSGLNKNWGEKHFQVIAKNLQPGEDVLMTFIGLHNYISPTNHNGNCAFAITNKRILIGQKKIVGEFFQIVQLNMLNDITMNSGFVLGVITIDTMKEKFNVAVDKKQANNILQKIHDVIYASKGIQNQANIFSKGNVIVNTASMIKCPNCGASNPENSKFCNECGAKLLAVCSSCGHPISFNTKFCNECGTANENYINNSGSPQSALNNDNEDVKYQVKLTHSKDKIKTIKIVRDFTNLRLREAKKIVDSNAIICENVDFEEATAIETTLRSIGTEVSITEQ